MAMSELKLIVDQAVEEMGGWNDAAIDRWTELSGVDVRAIDENTPFDIDVANRLLATFPQVLEELMAGPAPFPEEPTPEEVMTDLSEMAKGLGEALGIPTDAPETEAPEAAIPELGLETGVSEEPPLTEAPEEPVAEPVSSDSSSIDALIKELESLASGVEPTLKVEVPAEAPTDFSPEHDKLAPTDELPVGEASEKAVPPEVPPEIPPEPELPVLVPEVPDEAPVSEILEELATPAEEEVPMAEAGPGWEIPAPVAEELERATRIMEDMEAPEYDLAGMETGMPGFQAACVIRDNKVVARHSRRDVDWTALSQVIAAANRVFKDSLGIEEHHADELVFSLGNLFVLGFLLRGAQIVVIVKSDRLGTARAYASAALKKM